MRAMVACCSPSVNTMQVDGQTHVALTFDPVDLLSFIKRDFLPMNEMCDRAEMFEERIYSPRSRTRSAGVHRL